MPVSTESSRVHLLSGPRRAAPGLPPARVRALLRARRAGRALAPLRATRAGRPRQRGAEVEAYGQLPHARRDVTTRAMAHRPAPRYNCGLRSETRTLGAASAEATDRIELMNISVIGTGYVGLVSGTCFALRDPRSFCAGSRPPVASRPRRRLSSFDSLIRCASPPLSVRALCPSLM